ncbi:hypothetical protein PMAYCL1PPCAC_15109, partial [Pristionchus mayeri]
QPPSCFLPPCLPVPTCVVELTPCLLSCDDGEICVWKMVQCPKEPCPSVAACEPDQSEFPYTCAGAYCRRDMKCVMDRGVAVCIPRANYVLYPRPRIPPYVTCSTLGCQPGERCVETKRGAKCERVQCGHAQEYDRCFDGCEPTCGDEDPV